MHAPVARDAGPGVFVEFGDEEPRVLVVAPAPTRLSAHIPTLRSRHGGALLAAVGKGFQKSKRTVVALQHLPTVALASRNQCHHRELHRERGSNSHGGSQGSSGVPHTAKTGLEQPVAVKGWLETAVEPWGRRRRASYSGVPVLQHPVGAERAGIDGFAQPSTKNLSRRKHRQNVERIAQFQRQHEMHRCPQHYVQRLRLRLRQRCESAAQKLGWAILFQNGFGFQYVLQHGAGASEHRLVDVVASLVNAAGNVIKRLFERRKRLEPHRVEHLLRQRNRHVDVVVERPRQWLSRQHLDWNSVHASHLCAGAVEHLHRRLHERLHAQKHICDVEIVREKRAAAATQPGEKGSAQHQDNLKGGFQYLHKQVDVAFRDQLQTAVERRFRHRHPNVVKHHDGLVRDATEKRRGVQKVYHRRQHAPEKQIHRVEHLEVELVHAHHKATQSHKTSHVERVRQHKHGHSENRTRKQARDVHERCRESGQHRARHCDHRTGRLSLQKVDAKQSH